MPENITAASLLVEAAYYINKKERKYEKVFI